MADTSNCCGGPKGKHLKGCDGASNASAGRGGKRLDKAIAKRASQGKDYESDKERQQREAKRKNIGKERSTEWMNAEIPQGYRSAKQANGKYKIVPK